MFRVALRTVLAHRARLVMTLLAVLLGVAFVSATLVFTATLTEAYARSSEQGFDHLDVRIRPTTFGESSDTGQLLDRALLDRAARLPEADSATGVAAGFAALVDGDGEVVGEGWTTQGMSAGAAPHPIVEGRAPAADGEIAIDAYTADRTGYRIGDIVRLTVSGPILSQRIVGIFDTDDGNVAAGGTLMLFDESTAQRHFARPDHYTYIDLTASPASSAEALRERAAELLPFGFEAVTAGELAKAQVQRNTGTVSTLSQVLLACAGIALFVGVFLIVNTFTMLVTQRTRELALLRAVGAGRGQVTRSVLAEAAIVGLVAAAAGLALGIVAAAGVRGALVATGANLPDGPLVIDIMTVAVSLAIGVGVTMLAAWLPARHAASIPPVAALRSIYASATTRSLVVRNVIGATFALGGTALAVVAGTVLDDGRVWLALGAVVLMIGVLILTPLLSRPMLAAAGPALRRYGTPGRLAGLNALRNPRRTAATASALTIGLTLVTALSVIASSANKATEQLARGDYFRVDYVVATVNAGPLATDIAQALGRVPGVAAWSPSRQTQAIVGGVPLAVGGFNTEHIDQLINFEFTQGYYSANADTAVVDRDTASALGWRVGDTIPVTWPDGAQGSLTITGIYFSNFDRGVKVDTATMDPHLDRITAEEVLIKAEGGPSEEMTRALAAALGGSAAIRIADKDDLVADISGTVGLILNILYGMLGLAVVVAILGVVNTLAMSVHERAHEIGLLRAVGMDRGEIKRMVRLESIVISLFGGVLGLGLGVFLGWAVGELVATIGIDTWTLAIPWARLALFLACAALVGVLAALWPARRAAKLDILTAIRTD